ncbi:CaiB/BaiF CoA transferase family protein [Bacillus paramycoides]|uniref:Carnitine dehydratase n=1 Tax=Bacillus paramycoides TaxID=2026194 RepID=A0A1J9UX95_9BACI|nr:CaiB/BaiF CoA-transferase family protein [Bacillus paramycoides]OJD82609.1 carnitine dehydratase [Bacillus paramycoides]
MALLNSIKILDFSGLLPGPYATMMLADLGAEVLRVESPTRPDLVRNFYPKDGEESAAHGYLNRSKQSITLDLKKSDSVNLVKQLIQEYDIVLEQFRPGVMKRLGLGYEELREVNPNLIYCSLTGYGQNGPYRNRPGHDNNYMAISGVAGYSARKNSRPVPMGIQIADIAGGSLHTVIAILTAVIHRKETGEGQYIDVSMTDTTFALNALFGPGYLTSGIEPTPEKTVLNGGTFYDYYETKDGRYFSVGSLESPFRKLLCEAIGHPELIELGMSENEEDIITFKEIITKAFLSKTYKEWSVIFADLPACVEPVLKFSEACEHLQIKAREMIVEVPKPDGTSQRQIACPIKFSAYKPEYRFVGVKVGAHTEEILQKLKLKKENQIFDTISE